ncbi:Protein of unknown function [Cotesia congregata]|uniref:Uncharacterized protein n=1 Tax=Cotesia congregata TaxID=51543 RepID=A0A8J2MWW5_COTCN|nr:Protein of unknown function [Cotesia congregata]
MPRTSFTAREASAVFNGDKSLSDVNVTATSFVVLHVAEETLASCVLHLVNSVDIVGLKVPSREERATSAVAYSQDSSEALVRRSATGLPPYSTNIRHNRIAVTLGTP